ncbi:MAG: DUF58 domain-containing protein [Pseudobdellovibrio sp.]
MKLIHFRTFKESFFQLDTSEKINESGSSLMWENGFFRTLFTGFSQAHVFCYMLLLTCLGLSFYFRLSLVVALTLLSLLIANYFFLRNVTEKVILKFDPPTAAIEKQKAYLTFTLSNLSHFSLTNLMLRLDYDGSSKPQYVHFIEDDISPRSHFRDKVSLECDIGMGKYSLKNICLVISDPFNIFQFRIYFSAPIEIEVQPKIEALPEVKTRGSEYSELYGTHEVQNRGLSVNFSNIRPYSFGDSIRHIAWRPSARLGSLVVKEFEKMVNTDSTILLNLNPAHQIGYDLLNTWETAKDIALSLTSQMLDQGNSVEFIYNYGIIEKSNYRDQFYNISQALVDHNMFDVAEGIHNRRVHIDDPLDQWRHRLKPGTTLFYVGAANYPYLRDATPLLKLLSREKVEVILTLINPLTVWSEFRNVDSTIEKPDTTSKINQLLAELQETGVRVILADMGGELMQNFTEKSYLTETLKKSNLKKTIRAVKS